MLHRASELLLVGVVAGCLWGCGGGGSAARGGGPQFPSRASLAELASMPAGNDAGSDRKTVVVDEWQPGADEATSEAEALVTGGAGGEQRRTGFDRELGCAAREMARFYAAHEAFPDQQLQAHIAGVCGATAPTFGVGVWGTPNETLTTDANRAEWQKGIQKQLAQWLPDRNAQLGVAQISDAKNTVFAAVMAKSTVTWESKSLVVNEAGEVELSGSVRTPAALIYGMSNVGAHGVQDCRRDPRVALPRFHLTCKLDDADSAAWVDVEALPPGRVLARGVARLLIRREGVTPAFNAKALSTAPESVPSPAAFSQRLLALINEARVAAQLPAVKLATRQSETSARLAPHYFKDALGEDTLNDRIALGLLAGWDVSGTIRSGDFYSGMLSGSLDPRRWLGFMLDQPSARRVLLAPEARSIAIGPDVRAAQRSVGALISTYAFYDSEDHRSDVEQFLSQLNEQRRGLGLAPAKVTSDPDLNKAVRAVKRDHDPESALQAALQRVVSREQRGVEGFYIEANDMDYVTFPEALLRPSVTIAISAAHHRYPEAAWGTLTLLVVVLDSNGAQRTAQVSGSRIQ